MKQTNIKKLKSLILLLILGFVLLFVFRMIYGYSKNLDEVQEQTQQFVENTLNARRNYASKEYQIKSSNVNQTQVKVDQKYEKIAEINTKSNLFEDDERQVRTQIDLVNALIQFGSWFKLAEMMYICQKHVHETLPCHYMYTLRQ